MEAEILTIKDMDMDQLIPNNIDGIIIYMEEGRLILEIPSSMTGEGYLRWRRGRGGVFFKDLKSRKANYVLIEGEGEKLIARIIEEDEEIPWDGVIKDKKIMILKKLQPGEALTGQKLIEEPETLHTIDQKEDSNYSPTLSLIDD